MNTNKKGSINSNNLQYALLSDNNNKPSSSSVDIIHVDHADNEDNKNKLGTLNGCYVPCLLNIMGIILFERLGWGIGNVGVSGVLLIFFIAEIQAIITVLSLCAIVTNGTMKGGGSYFMISRTLGPEFGGSIGILFYSAYCVGVAFYSSGFAAEIVSTFFADSAHKYWLENAFASSILFICLFLAIFISLCALFFRGTFELEGQSTLQCEDGEGVGGEFKHFEWTMEQFKETWAFVCDSCSNFAYTFGVLFPAATGIMEGANLSGDLKNPSYSIPVGTLSAVFTSILFYVLLIIAMAGSFNQCTLRQDLTIMQECAWGDFGTYLVISGIIISASSSALGSLFGGSRVLQAISRDKLFPGTTWFEYGSPHGDEPRTCVLITWLIAQSLIFVGDLDTIATISTSFFCLSYATVNFSCFLLAISGTPNFRPSFTYYSWHIALFGTISNLVVMFYVDWKFGVGAVVIEIAIFVFLIYRAPDTVWGDVAQSILFHQVRKYLLRLDERKKHVKSWRPSILLLADSKYSALIDFCNNLKKGGLYIIGTSIKGDFGQFEKTMALRKEWIDFIADNELKAFPQINVAPNLKSGLENLILLCGLGALQPNTVILPLIRIQKESIDDDESEEEKGAMSEIKALVPQSPASLNVTDYTHLCQNILKFDKNIVITANFRSFDSQLIVSDKIQQSFLHEHNAIDPIVELNVISSISSSNNEGTNEEKKEKQTQNHRQSDVLRGSIHHDFIQNVAIPKSRNDAQWIDIWLNANDYSFEMKDIQNNVKDNVFPMLMMQISHILLQNKVWIKTAKAKLRVLLIINNEWNMNDRMIFDAMLKKLRLNEVHQWITVKEPENYTKPKWSEIMKGTLNGLHLKKYYDSLNNTIKSLSSESYFTFMKLPQFPPFSGDAKKDEQMNRIYYQSLYVLLRGLPPTALVGTGENEPVISIDL